LQDGGLGDILKLIQEREFQNRIEDKKKKFKNKLQQKHIAEGMQGERSMNGNYVHCTPGSNREYLANKCSDKYRNKIKIAWYNKYKKNNVSCTNARSSQDLMWPIETPMQRAQKKYKHLLVKGLLISHEMMTPSMRSGSATKRLATEPHNSDKVHTQSLVLPTISKAQNPFGPGYYPQPFKHHLPIGFSSMQRQVLSPPLEDSGRNLEDHISKMLRDSAHAEPSIQKFKQSPSNHKLPLQSGQVLGYSGVKHNGFSPTIICSERAMIYQTHEDKIQNSLNSQSGEPKA
jgi:hypothetical protein